MTTEVKPEVIKRTQELLGKHIKKPPLTEKLLKKPPFRFLHDIVTSVIRGTGFLEGVLTADEMNHENIKDKEGKIVFLQKIIDFVAEATGTQLTVRPTKIVSGHEPTKTNELLQAIAKALDEKQKKKDVSTPTQGLPKKVATKVSPLSKQASTKDTPPKRNVAVTGNPKQSKSLPSKLQERSKSKEGDKKRTVAKVTSDSVVKRSSQSKTKTLTPNGKKENVLELGTSDSDRIEATVNVVNSKEQEETDIADETVDHTLETDTRPTNVEVSTFPDPTKEEDESAPPVQELEMKRPPSAHFRQRKSSDVVVDAGIKKLGDALVTNEEVIAPLLSIESEQGSDKIPARRPMSVRPPTARPASARPAAPRIRDRGDVPVKDEANLAAGNVSVSVITDNDTNNNQDEDDFLIVQSKPVVVEDDKMDETAVPLPEGQQGHLVAQILETQKDFEIDTHQEGSIKNSPSKRVDIEWEGGRKRDREVVKQEVNKLRTVIQKATSVVNPFGKLMDYVQEDVDAMHRELEMWRETNKQLTAQLREEQRITDQAIEPMKLQLDQLEESIREKRDQISALKSTVIHNDIYIKQLLMGEVGATR